jgi:archaellum component FlaC
METWEKAALAGTGALTMWIVQFIAGRFLKDSFNLRREKIDELVNTIKKLEETVSKVSDTLIVVQEKYTTFDREIIEMKADLKVLHRQMSECQIKIAEKHPQ